jgi:hypothetical protein
MLKLRIRVPTNAQSFSVKSYFFSAEYPEWVCTQYNDFFVTLLDSGWAGAPDNPSDKNLAYYDAGGVHYPVGVNLAPTGLFSQCQSDETGCSDGIDGPFCTCAGGPAPLAGTGFDQSGTGCGYSSLEGGGTGWLTTSGNVNRGEVMEIRFAIWDTGDQVYDSLVLLDNFQWSVTPSQPGTEQ